MSDTIEFDFANFRAHLHKLAHPDTENPDASDLTQMVIEASRDYIKNILEVSEIEITTVRERSGFREERLRHVYASPPEVRDWFETTDQEWADTDKVRAEGIESITFNDPRAKPKCSICLEGPTCYCSVFKIVGRKIVRSKKKGIQPEYHIFPDRINKFLRDIYKVELLREKIAFDEIDGCLVFGLTETCRSRTISQMFALYVTDLPEVKHLDKKVKLCVHIVAEMFRIVEEIQVRERLEIERRALSDILELVPIFADEEVSPSDAVATLLNKFDVIFEDHGYFGPDRYLRAQETAGINEAGKTDEKSHQWVTFLSINYRESDKEDIEPPTPVLSVYPKSKARINYVQSYRVSRPDELSISKFLLHKFFKQQNIPTSQEFHKRFEKVKVKEDAYYKEDNVFLGLVLTKKDRVWKTLQFDIFGQDTKTTAAFLLRRSRSNDKRPFAILVFESDHADAFSKNDIKLISRLVNASASLHGHIKIYSQSLDYSARIKEAFSGITDQKIGAIPYWQVAYELMRLDHLAAIEILDCKDKIVVERLWNKKNALADQEVRKQVLDVIQEIDKLKNPKNDKDAFNRWLWNNDETFESISKRWNKNIKDIHDFLRAVPPNDVWHCYLGSIDRALANRRFGPSRLPEFTPFQTGYSALAMFVVDAELEERQIAKLTTKEKLDRERANHTEHVRYKIPLAARIPTNGIAFDTVGTALGDESPGNDDYGVIISDLIAGSADSSSGNPVSFLSLCADEMIKADKIGAPSIEEITDAINYHFTRNISIWISEGKKEWSNRKDRERRYTQQHIERLTRTGAYEYMSRTDQKSKIIDERLDEITTRLLNESSHLSNATLRMLKATELYFNNFEINHKPIFDQSDDLQMFAKTLKERRRITSKDRGMLPSMVKTHFYEPSFIHGDLNGNNLTWAAHYKRFVMIDFEYISLGFVGIDQLKLLASMICETIPTAREQANIDTREHAVLDIEHHSIISLIKLVPWLINDVIQAGGKHAHGDPLNDLWKKAKKKENTVLMIALAIIRTINFESEDGLDLKTDDEKLFWRWTMRNLFFTQFEYAYRGLNTSHIKVLDSVTDSIVEVINNPDNGVKASWPNVLKNAVENNVIMLFYAFLALLPTLKREG